MTQTFEATFDGEVFKPAHPVDLAPNTRVHVTISIEEQPGNQFGTFLRTASALELDGPEDWSSRLDDYLYGGAKLP